MSTQENETETATDTLSERLREINTTIERISPLVVRADADGPVRELIEIGLTLGRIVLTTLAEMNDAVQLIAAVMHEEHRVKEEKENPQSRRDARNFIGSKS